MTDQYMRLLRRIGDSDTDYRTVAGQDKVAIRHMLMERDVLLSACVSTLTLLKWDGRCESHPTSCGCSVCRQIDILQKAIAFAKGGE